MEWLWHVDDDDLSLGRVERSDAHARGLRHRSGIVFLLDARGHVYLTSRSRDKAIFPGMHDASASFHVAWGESYAEAAQREAAEELGLHAPLCWVGKLAHDDPPESQIVAVFVMRHAGEAITLDPREASGGAFRSLAELARVVRDEPCTPWLRDGSALLLDWMRTQGGR